MKRPHGVFIALLFMLSLVMIRNIGGDVYAFWDRILPTFDPLLSLTKDYYIWDISTLGGRYYVFLSHIVFHTFLFLLSSFISVGWANTILFWLLFLSSGLFMYAFVLDTFDATKKGRNLAAFVAAAFYMFNPYWVIRLPRAPLILFILAFLPLLLLLLRRAINVFSLSWKKGIRYALAASVLTVFMSSGLAELPSGLLTALFVGTYGVIFSLVHKKFKSFLVVGPLIACLSLLLNIWWIAPNLIHNSVSEAITKKGYYLADSLASIKIGSKETGYLNTLRGMGYEIQNIDEIAAGRVAEGILDSAKSKDTTMHVGSSVPLWYKHNFFILLSFLLPVIIIIPLFFKKEQQIKKEVITCFATLFLFVPLFFIGLNPPFGSVVKRLVEALPLFVFRRPDLYTFLLFFIYAYLFGIGLWGIYIFFTKKQMMRAARASVIILLFLFIGVFVYPIWLGQKTIIQVYTEQGIPKHVSALAQPPKYVRELAEYLNQSPKPGGVLILPKVGSVRAYNWDKGYFGFDIYYLTLRNRPVLTTYRYDRLQPNDNIYNLVEEFVNHKREGFATLLSVLNIKYIIVTEDALRWGKAEFDTASIHRSLSQQQGLTVVKRFGKHVLYETIDEPRLFYASTDVHNVTALDVGKEQLVRYALASTNTYSSVFDVQATEDVASTLSLFVKSGYASSSLIVQDEERITTDEQGVAPELTVEQINPIRFVVSTNEAATLSQKPFYLVSAIFFDPGWKADIDGRALRQIRVNGAFTGWVVEGLAPGERITVYYKKQNLVFTLFILSGATLLLTCICFLIFMRQKKTLWHPSPSVSRGLTAQEKPPKYNF